MDGGEEARVRILECETKRHSEDIRQIWIDLTDIKVCVAEFKGISQDMKELEKTVKGLQTDLHTTELISKEQAGKLAVYFLIINSVTTVLISIILHEIISKGVFN